MVTIGLAGQEELSRVLNFYRETGYRGGAHETDTILVARVGSQLVGAVRLCATEGVIVLRGMQVHREYQRQGIGTALLRECVPMLDAKVSYCLPYDHLNDFYQIIDFRPVLPTELPSFLARRLEGYLASDPRMIGMRRNPPN